MAPQSYSTSMTEDKHLGYICMSCITERNEDSVVALLGDTDPFLLLLGLFAELSKGVIGVGDGSGSRSRRVGGKAAPRLCILQLQALWLHTAIAITKLKVMWRE